MSPKICGVCFARIRVVSQRSSVETGNQNKVEPSLSSRGVVVCVKSRCKKLREIMKDRFITSISGLVRSAAQRVQVGAGWRARSNSNGEFLRITKSREACEWRLAPMPSTIGLPPERYKHRISPQVQFENSSPPQRCVSSLLRVYIPMGKAESRGKEGVVTTYIVKMGWDGSAVRPPSERAPD